MNKVRFLYPWKEQLKLIQNAICIFFWGGGGNQKRQIFND